MTVPFLKCNYNSSKATFEILDDKTYVFVITKEYCKTKRNKDWQVPNLFVWYQS
jgi:hypothetical protein